MEASLSAGVLVFLNKIVDATNDAGKREGIPQRFQPLLDINGAMDCLYRKDMPTELWANSNTGTMTLLKMKQEIGKKREEFALTDDTAEELVRRIDNGDIVFKFSF
jgi:hypothetical protein